MRTAQLRSLRDLPTARGTVRGTFPFGQGEGKSSLHQYLICHRMYLLKSSFARIGLIFSRTILASIRTCFSVRSGLS